MVKKISVMHFIPLLISKIRVRSGRDERSDQYPHSGACLCAGMAAEVLGQREAAGV